MKNNYNTAININKKKILLVAKTTLSICKLNNFVTILPILINI